MSWRGILLSLTLCFLLGAASSEAQPLRDQERDLGLAAFPDPSASRYSVPATPALNEEVQKTLTDAGEVLRFHPEGWFDELLPGRAVSAGQKERILLSAPGIPVRICGEECPPCPGTEPACLGVKDLGTELGMTLFFRKCALEGVPCRNVKQPLELRRFLEESLGLFAILKVSGTSKKDAAILQARKSVKVLRNLSDSLNGILSRCPGPYLARDQLFLEGMGSLGVPGKYQKQCGEKLLRAYQSRRAQCSSEAGLEILRCDQKCQVFLCMARGKTAQVRSFEGKRKLLLRQESCNGSIPVDEQEFLKQLPKGC